MRKSTTRTFSINDDVYENFIRIINDKKINKSRLIEGFIKEFIIENEK